MDEVIMPKELTAENGAKMLLIGEFFEKVSLTCPECDGDSDKCIACCGSGKVTVLVPVSWDTIKKIYRMAVQRLSKPVAN